MNYESMVNMEPENILFPDFVALLDHLKIGYMVKTELLHIP